MADAVDFTALLLEHQKDCISIITESAARAARDAIAFADTEDRELRMMRLNSISQAVTSGDRKLAAALIKHSAFSAQLLELNGGKPALRDPQAFEEAFADAKRAHINKERQQNLNDFYSFVFL